jgi:hypothetical protein
MSELFVFVGDATVAYTKKIGGHTPYLGGDVENSLSKLLGGTLHRQTGQSRGPTGAG